VRPREVSVAALLLAAIALVPEQAAAQPPRTIYIPAAEYPSDVTPGDSVLEVKVRYALGDDGRFVLCEVQRSSGHPSLDAASCRLLQERARFRPERGTRRGTLLLSWMGRPTRGGTSNAPGAPIAVSLIDELSSDDYPTAALSRDMSGSVGYDVLVSATGVPLRCTVTESSGHEILDRRTCEIVMERSAFIPASNGAGGTARGIYRSRINWRISG
jgi:TonB family protein